MLRQIPLVIRIKKGADGRTTLTCIRSDGTTTWQRQEGAQAGFFPRHDLTHYAVESVLGHREGFYGLVAAGWDLSDFGTPWPRGHLPRDANVSEIIVGFFDRERATGVIGTAEELNCEVSEFSAKHGMTTPPAISEEEIQRVRETREDLFRRWDAVAPGDSLELKFGIQGAK